MNCESTVTLDCIIFGLQRFGGISNYWAQLVEHAYASPQMPWRLTLPKTLQFHAVKPSWTTRLPSTRERMPTRLARYLPAPASVETGVFHTSYYRWPRQRVQRYIVTAYDFTYERYRSGLARFVHSSQKMLSLRRADAVICISESTRRDVLEFCGNIDASRVFVVPLGVDTHRYFRDGADVGDGSLERVVLFVGQRTAYKRFDLAVEAIRACPDLQLGIVGPPLTDTEQEQLQARLGRRWRAFGAVPADELRKLYSSAHAFIFPSDYEGFGLPVLESMACGCPVVAANSSSLPEVGGSAAMYAADQRGDAYAQLLARLDDPSQRASLIEAGFSRVREFPWSRTLEQTMSIYRGS